MRSRLNIETRRYSSSLMLCATNICPVLISMPVNALRSLDCRCAQAASKGGEGSCQEG